MIAKQENESSNSNKNIKFSHPNPSDGYGVNQLIKASKPLDENSLYCNLLQCSHFAQTCMCAKQNNELCAWVSGYIEPDKTDTLFVWQIAVSVHYRGMNLGLQLLQNLLKSKTCSHVKYLETTITKSNKASHALFKKLANILSIEHKISPYFHKDSHFNGLHESEELITIGPFNN